MKRHHSETTATDVPVEFPLVQMRVQADGTMSVEVNGAVYMPPQGAPAWHRGSFSAVLEAISAEVGTAVKVVVTEHDGTVFTDIVMPHRNPATRVPEPQHTSLTPPAHAAQIIVTGHGFLAGEDVALAPLVAHTSATPDGQINTLAARELLPQSGVRELLLIGRVSGTVQIVRALP